MNFDLNIDNYTKDELIEMFELPETFDKNIFDIKEAKLKESIINNKEINKDTQVKTLNFLIKAKNIILNEKQNGLTKFQRSITDFYNSSYDLKTSKLENSEEHMVQVRPEKPYLSSYPSEFFPGIINPLKKRTIKKNLNIDSRFRDNYFATSSTNYSINLPINFNSVLQMQLSSIELPTTYYVVSKQYGNNFFTVIVNGTAGIVNIPDGNYDQVTIYTIINQQLTNLSITTGITDFAHVVFSINLTNGTTGSAQTIVGFDGNQVANSTLELNFQADRFGIDDRNTPLPLKMGWNLGFRNGVYINNTNYVSEGVVDLTGPRYFFLVVDDYNNNVNNSFYSAFNSSILNKNILARISLAANTYDVLSQNNLNLIMTPREYFGPVNIQTLNIQLLDEYGRTVDLNNMDFSFCLTLSTVYDL
uniref:Uncharacterized protein n=1 Tax=viral metagenome TaxID=1070528 RepID=A0A6C0IDL6_9ZZZZ